MKQPGRNSALEEAYALFRDGKYEDSNKAYFEVLRSEGREAESVHLCAAIARNHLHLGEFTEARKRLAKCLEMGGSENGRGSIHALLAFVEFRSGDWTGAVDHCLDSLRLLDEGAKDPESQSEYTVLSLLGIMASQEGDAVTAERYLEEAIALHDTSTDGNALPCLPTFPETLLGSGRALQRQEKSDEALEVLEQALGYECTRHDRYRIHAALGAIHGIKKDYTTSAQHLEKAIEYAGERSSAGYELYLLGCDYQWLGDHAKAVGRLQEALHYEIEYRLGPWHLPIKKANVYSLIAAGLYWLGKKREGEEWYSKALHESRDAASRRHTLEWMAGSLAEYGETERAVRMLKRVAALAEGKAGKAIVYLRIAMLLRDAGRPYESRQWVWKSVDTHPTSEGKTWLRRT